MACAADMAKAGCEVIVYEAFHEPGGMLKYGIPDFRLPNAVVDVEIDKLKQLGVRFSATRWSGSSTQIEQMVTEMGFHLVFIGTGAGYPSFMGIPGESLNGVLSANRLLHPLQLDAGAEFAEVRHAADAGQARRGDRRGQHGDGRAARVRSPQRRAGAFASIDAARRKRRRARRRSITRARRASSSTG